MSESDYPFELVQWGAPDEITPEFICSLTNESADASVQETDVDSFLREDFQDLAELIKDNLTNPKVYKVGRINMPVYIVGRSPEGNWLGISTRVVET